MSFLYAPVFRGTPQIPSFVAARFAEPRRASVQEDDNTWTVTLDVPGVTREDLDIEVEGQVVRIETRKEAPRRYARTYELPQEIDVEATSAKLENGVLTLTLTKQKPVSRARRIPLN